MLWMGYLKKLSLMGSMLLEDEREKEVLLMVTRELLKGSPDLTDDEVDEYVGARMVEYGRFAADLIESDFERPTPFKDFASTLVHAAVKGARGTALQRLIDRSTVKHQVRREPYKGVQYEPGVNEGSKRGRDKKRYMMMAKLARELERVRGRGRTH